MNAKTVSETVTPSAPEAVATTRRGRSKTWLVTAALMVTVGSLASLVAARSVARNDVRSARQTSKTWSVEIAGALKLAIQHEQDLAISAGAFIDQNPDASNAQFARWVSEVRALQRYPEIEALAEVAYVPAARVQSFAHRYHDASTSATTPFVVAPAGPRSYYCLVAVDSLRPSLPKIPLNYDLCTTSLGPEFQLAADLGRPVYAADDLSGPSAFAVGTPIYRGGVVPSTVAGRRAALVGWTGTQIKPATILKTALAGHPGLAVAFRFTSGTKTYAFTQGHVSKNAASHTIAMPDGGRVQVYSAPIEVGIAGYANSLGLLFGGILFSLLVALLVFVLGTSRSNAVHLVSEKTDQLQHQALHDSLTGLPNRALILDRIGQMLSRARRLQTPVAALFLDLDNFKDINDTLGHRAGDELLVSVGQRLASVVRDSDTVGRLGGDEFVVVAEGASLEAGVDVVAQRILDVLSTPFLIVSNDVPLYVTASIGIAEGLRTTPEELLQDADIAMYKAKAAGRSRAVRFDPSMQESVDSRRQLDVDLQSALATNQFFLMFQPTVDLATGTFTGVEALLRWRHPTRGVVQPNDFIPALESSGLIVPVGAWVLEAACREGARWREHGLDLAVSVNVSARQLERDTIVEDVRAALGRTGFRADALVLELTETTLMHDATAMLQRLDDLKKLGVRIAIDDFGTGYSSLAYLRQFPIDILKIDRSFVSGIADSNESTALVHTLVQLGKVLGIETIAEGVETDDQRERLVTEKVDVGQGFLFSRPLEVTDVDRLFADLAGPAAPVIVTTNA